MTNRIEGKTYDAERSLYHLRDTRVENCTFAGPADGESVLKECSHVEVAGCRFSLRYPLWHAHTFTLARSELDEGTRAPIWYAQNGRIEDCTITGVKCLRECDNVLVKGGTVVSPEFGWKCRTVTLKDVRVESEYMLLDSRDIEAENLQFKGKYSFQYTENVRIRHSVLDTKDAFWAQQERDGGGQRGARRIPGLVFGRAHACALSHLRHAAAVLLQEPDAD